MPEDTSLVEINEQWQITFRIPNLKTTQERLRMAIREAYHDVERVKKWLGNIS